MPNTGIDNICDIDDICTGGNWPQTARINGSLGGPSTDADFDMEGPFEKFVPQSEAIAASMRTIKETGKPTRSQVAQAVTIQAQA